MADFGLFLMDRMAITDEVGLATKPGHRELIGIGSQHCGIGNTPTRERIRRNAQLAAFF
jgi:hypothetical protein